MRISGTDIYIAQGDSGKLTLSFSEAQEGLKMWIGIKTKINKTDTDENPAVHPIEQESGENPKEVTFTITDDYTQKAGTFYYDIYKETVEPIKDENGQETEETKTTITTIIRNSLFVVEPTARGRNLDQSSPLLEG